MERMEAAAVGGPALWPDLESFAAIMALRNRRRLDLPDPRGCADMLCAGFPCQPFSAAGKRRGTKDERWIWEPLRRAIALVRPRYVLLENVPGLLADTGGIGAILADLDALSYDTIRDRIPAADVGANHYRFRVWILAHAQDLGGQSRFGLRQGNAQGEPQLEPCNGRGHAADSLRRGHGRSDGRSLRTTGERGTATPHAPHATGAGLQEQHGIRRGSQPASAAAPALVRRNAEPAPGRVDDEPPQVLGESWYAHCPYPRKKWLTKREPKRAEQLHALGNGVVPEQCALALVLLATHAGWGAWSDERGLDLT